MGERTDRLLGSRSPAVDVREGLARLRVRSGTSSGGASGGGGHLATALATVAALLLAAGALRLATRSDSSPWVECEAGSVSPGAAAVAGVRRDVCCEDYDGGGSPDGGLLTVSRPDETVRWLIVYEDLDRSGTFSEGDSLRYRSPEACCQDGGCGGEEA